MKKPLQKLVRFLQSTRQELEGVLSQELVSPKGIILVTGAAGKTGQAVIRESIRRGATVRALVYRQEQARLLEQLGVDDVVAGDMAARGTLEDAVRGTHAVYHICPNMHAQEIAISESAIAAARSAGCERFVYHSVLHPQAEAMPHHWHKLRVEEKLLESGLPCTILQPAAYMQNVLASWDHISRRGVYAVPYAEETRLSMVDVEDVAEVAARVLTEPGHEGATYELSGPGFLSQTEVAAILGEQLGREVRLEVVPLDTWAERATASGLGTYQVESLVKMFRFYEHYGFRGSPRVLEWLLGRKPTSFRRFAERVARR